MWLNPTCIPALLSRAQDTHAMIQNHVYGWLDGASMLLWSEEKPKGAQVHWDVRDRILPLYFFSVEKKMTTTTTTHKNCNSA